MQKLSQQKVIIVLPDYPSLPLTYVILSSAGARAAIPWHTFSR
jgi:hypothetical protein